MKAKPVIGDTVRIKWEDSWSNQSYCYTQKEIQAEKPKILESRGILCRNDKMGMTLAIEVEVDEPYRFRHVQHIPRAMIRKIKIQR